MASYEIRRDQTEIGPRYARAAPLTELLRSHPKWSPRAQVPLLASHSWPRTCALLVSRTDALPPSDVVPHIRADARRLYEYLHALFSQARDAREICARWRSIEAPHYGGISA